MNKRAPNHTCMSRNLTKEDRQRMMEMHHLAPERMKILGISSGTYLALIDPYGVVSQATMDKVKRNMEKFYQDKENGSVQNVDGVK